MGRANNSPEPSSPLARRPTSSHLAGHEQATQAGRQRTLARANVVGLRSDIVAHLPDPVFNHIDPNEVMRFNLFIATGHALRSRFMDNFLVSG